MRSDPLELMPLGSPAENRGDEATHFFKLQGGFTVRSEKGHLADTLEDFGEGFEAIYRFEEIDARAVRKLRPLSLKTDLASAAPAAHALSAPQNKALIWKEGGEQAHFKWGHLGVRSLRSLKFGELIAALGLSAHIETRLIDSGLRLVGDLVEERGTFKQLQSLTHFQAEEVHQALAHYFQTCSTGLVSEFENKHFICILLASFDRRFVHCFLQEYDLQELIPLSEGQSQEVRRWSASQIAHARQSVVQQLKKQSKDKWIAATLQRVADALILPWMETRGGIATRKEVEEWMEQHSQLPGINGKIAHFLTTIFQWPKFIWLPALCPVAPHCARDLFASNLSRMRNCEVLLCAVDHCFYRCGQSYSLDFILAWLRRDWARRWELLDREVILKLLNVCSSFAFWRENDELFVEKVREFQGAICPE